MSEISSKLVDSESSLSNSACWRPIETAPKDGTEILVCGGIHGADSMSCEFEARFKGTACVAWDEGTFNRYCHTDDKLSYYYPTHWQPMPAPINE